MAHRKIKQAGEIIRLMEHNSVSVLELSRELKVTAQTVYNLRKGNASYQLLEHALLILDNWNETIKDN
jgi:DeoR/GlpR family transcriptional regulator of sugar metabolism